MLTKNSGKAGGTVWSCSEDRYFNKIKENVTMRRKEDTEGNKTPPQIEERGI